MMLRLMHLRLAAAALAIAMVSFAGAPARAFTFENQSATNSDGSPRFADPDNQVNGFSNGTQPFGPGGPTLQFNVREAPGPFSPVSPFHGYMPPQPQSFGNNNDD